MPEESSRPPVIPEPPTDPEDTQIIDPINPPESPPDESDQNTIITSNDETAQKYLKKVERQRGRPVTTADHTDVLNVRDIKIAHADTTEEVRSLIKGSIILAKRRSQKRKSSSEE